MAKKLTANKAKKILTDGSVHGKPLTLKQKRFFGAVSGGAPIKAQVGEEVNYKDVQDESMAETLAFLKDWYTKRATLPEFKDVSERRLKVLEKPVKTRYLDPEIMNAQGFAGSYNPTSKWLSLANPNPSFGDFPEYEKFMQYSSGSPLITHELFHRLQYEAPQLTTVVPEKIAEKIPGYPELTSPDYINLRTGKKKMTKKGASTFYPEMEAITGMLRQSESIDPLKPVTSDDVDTYIKKYDKYNKDIRMRDVDVDKVKEFHRGRLIKQLFDSLGNDPEKIANYLNSVAKNEGEDASEVPMAQEGFATRADSIAVRDRSLAVDNYFRNNPKYRKINELILAEKERSRQLKDLNRIINSNASLTDKQKKEDINREIKRIDSFHNRQVSKIKKEEALNKNKRHPNYLKELKKAREEYNVNNEHTKHLDKKGRIVKGKAPYKDYYSKLNPNQFEQREIYSNFLNLQSPLPLYDTRIVPQKRSYYEGLPNTEFKDDAIQVYTYDPLAVTPWVDIPSPELQLKRIEDYGVTGTPFTTVDEAKSVLTNQINSSSTNTTPNLNIVPPKQNPNIELPNSINQKSEYSLTYAPGGSSQITLYYPTYDAWKDAIDKANTEKPGYRGGRVQTSERGDKSSAQALVEGTPKFKSGGWLDKYEYGGEAGYTDVPFNYNSAWGGQFQPGGKLPIASSSSVKRNTLSKIGTDGKNDVNEFINYATIINSYPDIANDTSYIMNKIGPAGEEQFFYNTNRGNPISNYNKGRNVVPVSSSMSNDLRKEILAGVGGFRQGGSIPGSVGFTYARTGGIPSNGPYAKKTKASAENGMSYYQHGLDWKPKSMKKGGWLDKYEVPKNQNAQYTLPGLDFKGMTNYSTDRQQVMAPIIQRVKAQEQVAQRKAKLAQQEAEDKRQYIGPAKKLTLDQQKEADKRRYNLNKDYALKNDLLFNYKTGEVAKLNDKTATGGDWGRVSTPEIVQTAAFTTPSGQDYGAGEAGANFFVNTNPITAPITSAGRLTQLAIGQNPYGFNSNGIISNIVPTIGALGDIAGVGSIKMIPGVNQIGQDINSAIQASKESGLLSKAHTLNPFAGTFQGESKLPSFLQLNKLDDPNAYWRLTKDPKNYGLGEGAYFNKGVPLTKELAETFPKESRAWRHRYSGPKWNPKTGKIDLYDGPDYLFKVSDEKFMEPHLNFPEPHLKFFRQSGDIPEGQSQLFKKDWLQGWKKEVPKPTSISSSVENVGNTFKSEIDWGKWNPETPNYSELINEYNAIEESTKKTGTWMKNADGSPFQGTPEQFIQQQSSHFKKAFPEGVNRVYRGVGSFNNNPDFSKGYIEGDRGIFTANKELANSYAFGNTKNNVLTPFSSLDEAGIYDLGFPKGNQIDQDVLSSYWTKVNLPGGSSKLNLESHLDRLKKLAQEYDIKDLSKINSLEDRIKNYDNVFTNKEELTKLRQKLGDKPSTDEIAQYIPNTDLNNVTLRNILDGGEGDITIVNSKPGNYLKSMVGNVGFFDMTNPNVYKALVPTVLGAGVIGSSNKESDKKKKGGVIKDDMGQWAHPGEITEIGSNQITMEGVPYPVLGISDEGDTQMMYPEQEYKFKGKKVTEYPMAQKGEKVAPIYTDDPKKVQAYNDSLDLYNDYNRLKNILDKQYSSSDYIKKEENFPRNPDGSICYNCIKKEAERKKQVGNFVDNLYGKVQQLANPNINPIGYINYLKDNLFFDELQGKIYNYSNVKPVQPYILQQELQQSKDQPYLSDKEYSKKYPPIYVTNPKDPRIGQYSPEGNEYKYKEQPKSQPTLKKKVSKMEPIRSSYTPSLSIRTIQTPDIELPGIQMGDYDVSYYSPESKDWANRNFTSQEESDRFAQEMSQRGYPGSYGNVTQTKKTNKKSTGGWLDKYN
jgi:hypothetical protein